MAADYTALIQQLHLIYLGRQAMPIERAIMEGQLAAAGAPSTLDGMEAACRSSPAVAAIIDGLANATTAFGLDNRALGSLYTVGAIYTSLFGRSPDLYGLLFWANAIDSKGLDRNVAPLAIIAGAQANPSEQSHFDSTCLASKTAISDIIDRFALDLAPTLHWVVNSPSASSRALFYAYPHLPAADYVNTALIAYGVVKEVTIDAHPITIPPTIVAPPPPAFIVSMDAPSVAEGNSGKAELTFHLSLNMAPTSDVAVYYATLPGSAGKGDFQSTSGRVVFAAGQTSASVTVLVTGDDVPEQNETLSLIVGGSGIVGGEAIGTIVNDDVAVTLVGNHAPYHAPLLF